MADIFWDGFDKYGPVNCIPTNSTMNSEWTTVPSSSSTFVAGRFSNSLALQLTYTFVSASRTLPSNYGRLIGGIALNSTLAANSGVIFGDAGTNQCAVGFNTAGKLVLWTGGLGGTQVTIAASAITANTWHYVEWDLTFSATGSYNVYLDGVSVFSGTGNLKSSSNAYANQVILIGNVCNFDDMYLFDSTGTVNNAVRGDGPKRISASAFNMTIIGNGSGIASFQQSNLVTVGNGSGIADVAQAALAAVGDGSGTADISQAFVTVVGT